MRRTKPLPKNWPQLRQTALKTANYQCQATTNGIQCPQQATDVDHITPAHKNGTDTPDNLQALCRWHHNQKTAREAQAARTPQPPRQRPPEPHPGA